MDRFRGSPRAAEPEADRRAGARAPTLDGGTDERELSRPAHHAHAQSCRLLLAVSRTPLSVCPGFITVAIHHPPKHAHTPGRGRSPQVPTSQGDARSRQ